MNQSTGRIPVGFRIIGLYKLVTALLSLALGFGLFQLFKEGLLAYLEPLVRGLRLDPENRVIHAILGRIARST